MKIIKNNKVDKSQLKDYSKTIKDFSEIQESDAAKKQTPTRKNRGFNSEFRKIEELYEIKADNAYQKGFDAGKEEAAEELRAEYEKKVERLKEEFNHEAKNNQQKTQNKIDQLFRSFDEKIKKYQKSLINITDKYHKETIKISLAIVRKILKELAEKDKSLIKQNIMEALKKIDRNIPCRIKLNPEDLKFFNENSSVLEKISEEIGYKTEMMELSTDENIETGGCIVDTDNSMIDARISEQFKEIKKSLKNNYISF